MRKITIITAGMLLMSTAAFAGHCPVDMKAIDAALQQQTSLTAEQAAHVKKLRAEGEAAHKAGNHAESMQKLGEAKQILGI